MRVRIVVRDESPTGRAIGEQALDVPAVVTLREVIRHRVREEVAHLNMEQATVFSSLVQPTDAERTLTGYRMRAPRKLDWECQADIAIRGFETNAFFVLVGDRQLEHLDEELRLADADDVVFVRLVPLVGG